MLFVVRHLSLRRVDLSSRGILPSVLCLSVIVKPRQWGGPGPVRSSAPLKKKIFDPRRHKHYFPSKCQKSPVQAAYLRTLEFSAQPLQIPQHSCTYNTTWHIVLENFSPFLCALTKLRQATINCVIFLHLSLPLSVCPHGTPQLTLEGFFFLWKFIFEYLSKICRENSSFIRNWHEWRVLYMKANTHFYHISLNFS